MHLEPALPLQTTHWLNVSEPVTLAALKGRVVLMVAFQMLCPGCVAQALPQAKRARQLFRREDLAVIGLHTVFEHHDVQGSARALEVFLHEYGIDFPVGLDAPSDDSDAPRTMLAYHMRGTPTTILLDRQGRIRKQKYGHLDDMVLGAEIMALVAETAPASVREQAATETGTGEALCTEEGCALPVTGS